MGITDIQNEEHLWDSINSKSMTDKVTYYREVKASKDSDFHLYEWMPVAGEFIHMADLEPIEITEEEIDEIARSYCVTYYDSEESRINLFKAGFKAALSKLKGDDTAQK